MSREMGSKIFGLKTLPLCHFFRSKVHFLDVSRGALQIGAGPKIRTIRWRSSKAMPKLAKTIVICPAILLRRAKTKWCNTNATADVATAEKISAPSNGQPNENGPILPPTPPPVAARAPATGRDPTTAGITNGRSSEWPASR